MRLAVGEIRDAVDAGRLAVPAAFEQVLRLVGDAFDEDVDLLADHRLVASAADLALDLHELLLARTGDRGIDAVRQHRRRRARLDRVRERAGAIELRLGDELAQLVELGVGLAGVTDDERRAQHDVVDALAQLLHELARHAPRVTAAHALQHRVADVLERDVDVLDDLRLARDRVDQIVVERARERVVETDPLDAVDLAHRAEQLGERLARLGRCCPRPSRSA